MTIFNISFGPYALLFHDHRCPWRLHCQGHSPPNSCWSGDQTLRSNRGFCTKQSNGLVFPGRAKCFYRLRPTTHAGPAARGTLFIPCTSDPWPLLRPREGLPVCARVPGEGCAARDLCAARCLAEGTRRLVLLAPPALTPGAKSLDIS